MNEYRELWYTHVQVSLTFEQTLMDKIEFKAYSKSMELRIQYYHDENGRFSDHNFINIVNRSRHNISFCEVGASYQYSEHEKKIRDLREESWKMIVHVISIWTKEVNISL